MPSERKRIPEMCSREADGTTTTAIIRRRTQRTRKDVDLDKSSHVLGGSAIDDLIAKMFCNEFSVIWGAKAVV